MSNRIALSAQRLRRTPGLAKDVTVVVTAIAVGLGVTGVLLSHQRAHWPWQHDYTLHALFASAPAVSPGHGQEVRIAGVPVGEIDAASVNRNGQADLTLRLKEGYPVYRDASLVLRPKSPLNEMYVELNPGTPDKGRLASGATLSATQTGAPVQEDAVLQHLDGQTRAAVTSLLAESDAALATAQTELAPGLTASRTTLTDLKKLSDALASRRAVLAQLVTGLGVVAQAVGHDDTRIATLASQASQTLVALDAKNAQLSATLSKLPGFLNTLSDTAGKVSTLSTQLQPTLNDVDAAHASLPTALTRLQGTLDQLADLSHTAGPLVKEAGPLVRDLRPFVAAGATSLRAVEPFTARLDDITARMIQVLDYKHDGTLGYLKDFVYQTGSVGSLRDGNGGIFRAEFVESPGSFIPTLPTATAGAHR